jgi:hypothetical protein
MGRTPAELDPEPELEPLVAAAEPAVQLGLF